MGRIAAAISLAIFWPAAQLAVFLARFGRLPPGGAGEALVFVPMGVVTAVVAVWLWSRAESRERRRRVAAGYLIASPFAFLGGLLGGLVLPGAWGPLVVGGGLLVLGCVVGYAVGSHDGAAS